MNEKELKREILSLKVRIKELEEIKIVEDDIWIPNLDEFYWYVDAYCDALNDIWKNADVDNLMLSCGNIFKTKEEAEYESERLKVYRKLRQFALNKGRHVGCFCISYDYVYKEINYDKNETGFAKYGDLVFKTEEVARRAVETVGAEKVLKYYLEV